MKQGISITIGGPHCGINRKMPGGGGGGGAPGGITISGSGVQRGASIGSSYGGMPLWSSVRTAHGPLASVGCEEQMAITVIDPTQSRNPLSAVPLNCNPLSTVPLNQSHSNHNLPSLISLNQSHFSHNSLLSVTISLQSQSTVPTKSIPQRHQESLLDMLASS